MAKIKNTSNTKCGQGDRVMETFPALLVGMQNCTFLWKVILQFLVKLKYTFHGTQQSHSWEFTPDQYDFKIEIKRKNLSTLIIVPLNI